MSRGRIFLVGLCQHLPGWFIPYIFEAGSDPALQKIRENRNLAHRVARELIEQKRREMVVGQSEKDILSLLGASYQVAPPPVAKIDTRMVAL